MFDKLKSSASEVKGVAKTGRTPNRDLRISNILHVFFRFIQVIMACVVIGFYASDLNAARKVHKYSDSKWVYAVVVGSLSAVTAVVLIVIGIISTYHTVAIVFFWEWILVILWSAVTGIFGSMYRTENPEMDKGVQDMKTAWYFDCVNLAFWGVSAILATALFFTGRRGSSRYTGRAKN